MAGTAAGDYEKLLELEIQRRTKAEERQKQAEERNTHFTRSLSWSIFAPATICFLSLSRSGLRHGLPKEESLHPKGNIARHKSSPGPIMPRYNRISIIQSATTFLQHKGSPNH
ncbi:hypothetical protein N7540_000123 [Penicillium herquei]|nr:hypothetical protein N7540_000123 [Penicillium herquei]